MRCPEKKQPLLGGKTVGPGLLTLAVLSHAVKRLCTTNLASSLPKKQTARKIEFMVTSASRFVKVHS